MDVPDEVLRHYQQIDEGARISQGAGQLELLRVQEIVRRRLPPGRLSIADVGGGTGVHAAWLAADGHDVRLVDPVPEHVAAANALGTVRAEVGEAAALPFDDEAFDVVLLFGPLYHLQDHEDRLAAWGEARRVVRPGGLLFVAAISRFASLFDGLARGFLLDPRFRAIARQDLVDGHHQNPTDEPHWFTTAYFHHPDGLRDEATTAGLDVLEVAGVEGIAGWLAPVRERWEEEAMREAVLFAARATEVEPTLLGLSAHLVLTARRPSPS